MHHIAEIITDIGKQQCPETKQFFEGILQELQEITVHKSEPIDFLVQVQTEKATK